MGIITAMKLPDASNRTTASTNMTPMIDVVFLLIIFFLVSSHLAQRETRMPLDLPVAATHRAATSPEHRMTINVDASGQWQAGSMVIDSDRLPTLLGDHVANHGATAGVRIRTDRSVAYGIIEPLLRQVAQSGITDIAFAVHEQP